MTDAVIYDKRAAAAWVTLNRPEKLNALNSEVVAGLRTALERASADDEIKVVVLTGAGSTFSAGFDMAEEVAAELNDATAWRALLDTDVGVTMQLWALEKPTIAAVNGWCLGGACELAMACDMIVAAESARFGEPEIRYGSGPVTLLMPFVLGEKKTKELLFTGDCIDAKEAERVGLVNRVVSADRLEEAVEELVGKLTPTPLAVLRLTKIALLRAFEAKGLRLAVQGNLDLSAILNAADTPEQHEFDRIASSEGLRAALAWRNGRYGGGLA